MDEIRCGHCRKLLARGHYLHLQIKCPRCGAINDLRAASPIARAPASATDGA
ncbi:Com family DNA-binding transcriptional regulator [Jeongeupia sp. USM3]|uniref:Com family DNA-binding transcriptional regulator n=1 Tax=Jeongeupia sp. USM3 TaxID=1906741 RepID=UPI0009F3764D|nr:Com family DNA-binding transcriptional regulator [Jeongeupia sp. USM3]